jgi:hypothetical protein
MRDQIKTAAIGGIAGFLIASVGLFYGILPIYSTGTVTLAACAIILVCIYSVFRREN